MKVFGKAHHRALSEMRRQPWRKMMFSGLLPTEKVKFRTANEFASPSVLADLLF